MIYELIKVVLNELMPELVQIISLYLECEECNSNFRIMKLRLTSQCRFRIESQTRLVESFVEIYYRADMNWVRIQVHDDVCVSSYGRRDSDVNDYSGIMPLFALCATLTHKIPLFSTLRFDWFADPPEIHDMEIQFGSWSDHFKESLKDDEFQDRFEEEMSIRLKEHLLV
jgi:hypothetical protein